MSEGRISQRWGDIYFKAVLNLSCIKIATMNTLEVPSQQSFSLESAVIVNEHRTYLNRLGVMLM